jgi:hypothetical protein
VAYSSWNAARKTPNEKWPDLMGVERNSNVVEPEKSPDTEQSETDQSPPPDRSGELGSASRAESRRVAMEANQKAPEAATDTTNDRKPKDAPTTAQESSEQRESDTKGRDEQAPPENGETETTPPESTEQRRTDRETDSPSDSFEQRPSHGNFANLAEEFDARAKSREQVNELNSGPEEGKPDDKSQSLDFKVDDDSLRERIDPVGASEWSDGTAENPNPTGDRIGSALDEENKESAERSRVEKIRGAVNKNSEDLVDKAQQGVDKLDSIFGPRPTGQAETRTNSGPQAVDTHHSGVDPGSTASALLAAGMIGAELFHRAKTKIRGER